MQQCLLILCACHFILLLRDFELIICEMETDSI
jgi:hypothetical protein